MDNERVLNMKMPDKLYLSIKKAAEQKSISISALVRMICSDWIMQQDTSIKGIFTFPEKLLENLATEERVEYLETLMTGGFVYNQFGEVCFDADDDGEDDECYASLCTPEEIAESEKQLRESR